MHSDLEIIKLKSYETIGFEIVSFCLKQQKPLYQKVRYKFTCREPKEFITWIKLCAMDIPSWFSFQTSQLSYIVFDVITSIKSMESMECIYEKVYRYLMSRYVLYPQKQCSRPWKFTQVQRLKTNMDMDRKHTNLY